MSKHLSTHSGLTQFGNVLMRVCIILSMVLSNMAIQTTPVSADSGKSTRVEKVDLENAWDKPLTWLEDVGEKIGGLGEGWFKEYTTEVSVLDGSDAAGNMVGAEIKESMILYDSLMGSKPDFAFDEIHGLTAVYFNNQSLTPPALAVQDGETIDYNWGHGYPLEGMPSDRFSMRWYGKLINNEITEAEEFTFTSLSDDGVRLWIDGNLIIDAWHIQGPTAYYCTFTLEPGIAYDFVFEYFEEDFGAEVQLELESPSISRRLVTTADFQKVNLEEIQTDFAFSKVKALSDGEDIVSIDLSIKDQSNAAISADVYVKINGSLVYLNGNPISGSDWIKIDESGTPGVYQFDLSSFVVGEKGIQVKVGNFPLNEITPYVFSVDEQKSGLLATYFSNMTLAEPSFTTLENQEIDFEWGEAAPIEGMPADNFSIRWTGDIEANYSELYTFYTLSDDGMRLWIDGTLLVDAWFDQGPTYHSGQYLMAAGVKHVIVVEYYESVYGATAGLEWESISQLREKITRNNLSMPGADNINFDVDFSKTDIVSDGIDSAQITVQLTGYNGTPLYDEEVSVQISGQNNTFNGYELNEGDWIGLLPVGTTGQYIGDLKSTTKEIKQLRFMVGDLLIGTQYSIRFIDEIFGAPLCEITNYTNEDEEEVSDLTVTAGETCKLLPGEYEFVNMLVEGTLVLQSDNFYNEVTGDYSSTYVHITAEKAEVTETGHISADGMGYASGEGPGAPIDGDLSNTPGGGGFAGYGSDGDLSGGDAYFKKVGNIEEGILIAGSGGGGPDGGAGGGIVYITVNDSINLFGEVSANGTSGTNYTEDLYSGGGSGGTIAIEGSDIQGSGMISAKGGESAETCEVIACGGGGSGGQVLLKIDLSNFIEEEGGLGTIEAFGGAGKNDIYGASGYIFKDDATLIIDNNNQNAKETVLDPDTMFHPVSIEHFQLIRNAQLLIPQKYDEVYGEEYPFFAHEDHFSGDGTGELITKSVLYGSLKMTVDGYDWTIYDDPIDEENRVNFWSLNVKSGSTVTLVPNAETSLFSLTANRVTIDEGGTIRSSDSDGTILFNMDYQEEAGALTVEGLISINGDDGENGGNLQINANVLSGDGTIQANGGSGENYGDGGVVEVNYLDNQFTGSLEAFGGEFGDFVGNPGIITHNYGEKLIVNNNSNPGVYTFPEGSYAYDRIELGNGIELIFDGVNTAVTINDGVYTLNGQTFSSTPVLSIEGALNYSSDFIVDRVILNWAGLGEFNFDVNFSKTEVLRDGVDSTEIAVQLTDSQGLPVSGEDVSVRISGQGNIVDGIVHDDSEWVLLQEDESTGQYIGVLQSTVNGTKNIEFKVGYSLISTDYSVEFIELYQGQGLRGEYFSNTTFTGSPCMVVYGETINFENSGSWPNLAGSNCSAIEAVRWTGILTPELSGTYQFYTSLSQMNLWINGVQKESGSDTLSTDLVADQDATLVVELSGISALVPSFVKLEWTSDQVTREIIPVAKLSFVNNGQSSLTNSTNSILADGEATTQITVQAKRDDGRILDGYPVFIKISGDGNYLNGIAMQAGQWTEIGTTNATGILTGLISTDIGGAKQVTATVDGMLIQQTVSFDAIAPEVFNFQILFEGETAAPGTTTGKTGTIKNIYKGDPALVTFRVVSETFNLLSTANGIATLNVADQNSQYPQTVNIVNGVGQAYVTWSLTGDQTLSLLGSANLRRVSGSAIAPVTDSLIVANTKTVYTDAVRTYLMADLLQGGTTITVKSATGFYPGHRILLLTMTGTGAGRYEVANIASINGTQIQLATSATNSYPLASGKTIVLLVPRIEYVTVQSGGVLTTSAWDGNTGGVLYLDVAEVIVETGASIHVEAKGYDHQSGPGAGIYTTGGGYGGEGAASTYPASDGVPYGSPYTPFLLGSGGGHKNFNSGGRGAGIVNITASQIINDGAISATGGTGGAYYAEDGGGGSGGSVWIDTNQLTGTGSIQAIGGRGGQWMGYVGYGGGGGRIAIDVETNQYTGTVQAFGGYGKIYGGAGSIYWVHEDKLVIDNNNFNSGSFSSYLLSNTYNFDVVELKRKGSLIVRGTTSSLDIGQGILTGDGTVKLTSEGELVVNGPLNISGYSLDAKGKIIGATSLLVDSAQTLDLYSPTSQYSGDFTFGSVDVRSNATLNLHTFDDANDSPFNLVCENISVALNGKISLDGMGYMRAATTGNGPGGGWGSTTAGSYGVGGSHGGKAGANPSGRASAETYGDLINPVTFGSAGGIGGSGTAGNGGGALHLDVANNLTLNGTITANGTAALTTGGGGAGGSIWIEAAQVNGTGSLLAKGGASPSSSGGGGGRLSILAQTVDPDIKLNVDGGTGTNAGEHGTIYLETLDAVNSTVVANPPEVAVGGVAASTVTVTLMAQNGHGMPYKDITVTLVNGSGFLINGTELALNNSVTLSEANPNGQISFTASAITVGSRDLKISVDGVDLTQHAIINFDAGDFNPDLSTITSTPVNVAADGVSQGTITVTALDINSLPIMNVSIGLSASGDAVVTQPIGKTNASGEAIGYVSNAKVESVTVTGNAWGSPLNQTATVNFYGTDFAPSLQVPQRAVPGDEVSIAVTLRNNQAYLVEDVTLSLTLPEMLTFDSHTASTAPVINGQVYTWTIDTLAANQVVKFNVNGTISSTVAMGETLPISITASSAVTEINPANNTAQASIAIVQGYSFDASLSPVSQTLYPGGVVAYTINIANTDLLPDLYSLAITGLDAFTTTLSSDELPIDAGGTNMATLTVATNSCMAESSVSFTVRVTSTQSGITEDIPVTLALNMSPKITLTTPKNNSTSGSRSVLFSWQTDPSTTGKLTIYPTNDPTAIQVYTTVEGTTHSVQVENLVRNTNYSWFVESTSACGSGTSPVRNLTIGNGIVFTNHSQNITINRDYDQRVTVTVKNEDSLAHTLTSNVTNTYEDLIVNFVDSGSVDETITLEPGQSANLTLAIHAQDAAQSDYTLTANLIADEGVTPITDSAVLNVHVLFAGDYSIEEDLAAYNATTLAHTYVLTNHGQTITDLSLEAIDPNTGLPASIYLTPSLDHARLGTGESIRVVAYPIFTAEDAQAQEIVYAPILHMAKTRLNSIDPISYTLQANGGGNTVSLSGTSACDGGKQIYSVTMSDCQMAFKTSDWYCTNRPTINTPIRVPAFLTQDAIANISMQMEFTPRSDARSHNGQMYFNNTEVISFTNLLPTGSYTYPVPSGLWNESMAGMVTQNLKLVSQHPNGGHYVSFTGYQLNVSVDQAVTYACAATQTEAEQSIQQTYACEAGVSFNPALDVYDKSVWNLAEIKQLIKSVAAAINVPVSVSICTQEGCGDPIDSRTGVFSMSIPDISFPTTAGTLAFQRAYSSGAVTEYSSVGYGWTHNHEARLIFPSSSNGMEGYVLFKDPLGNQNLFKIEGDGSYSPGPGVLASLSAITDGYTVTAPDGHVFTFNSLGMITSLADAQGNAFSYIYNEEGQLTRVSADEDTRYLDFTYNAQGRIASVSDHTDREVTFTYDAKNNLATSTDLLNQEWMYTYDANHRMTNLLDPTGAQSIKTEYDMLGRAYRQYDGDGNMLVKIVYHDDGSVTMMDANGKTETHSYDSRGIMISGTDQVARDTDTVYDANFRPTSITNEIGSTLDMEWSADGKYLLAEEDPAGNRTEYTYDTLGNLTSTTDASGNTKSYTYTGKLLASSTDAEGKTTSYTYTPEGWLESQTDAYGRTTTYTYDDHGQRLTTTDWLGESTGYTYDELGNQTETVDAQGRISRNEYDDAGQLLRSIRNVDPARPQNDGNLYNLITSYTYDMFGNQKTVTDTLGHTTRYEYDSSGHLVRTIDAAVNITSNTYDGKGQLVSSTDARGNKTTYVYDAAGRRLSTVNALGISSGTTTFNLTNNTSTASDSAGNAAVYTYNALNQVVKIVDPMGHETITTYNPDGSVATKTDELGRITTYEYDDLNRLVKTTDGSGAVTQSVYDAEGNRVASIDALGNQTTYTYDDMGRVVSTTDALDHQTSSVYDDDGKLVSSTDTMGRTTTYEYDEWGRKSAMVDGAGRRTTYSYDLLDRVISTTSPTGTRTTTYDALGRVVSTTDEHGRTTTTTYDVLGRVKTSTDTNGNTTTNTYDAAGNLIASRVNDEDATRYTYDKLNRRITATDPLGNTSRTVYDALGNVSEEINAKGVVTHYIYDSLQRNTAVIQNYKAGVAASADTNVRVDYTYNAVGNRIFVNDANGHVTEFQYDAANRVTKKIDPLSNTWTYTYDLAGNLISRTDGNSAVTGFGYDDGGNLLSIDYPEGEADVSFTYDASGQRETMTDGLGTTTWHYDTQGRLESVTDATNSVLTYSYDDEGNRIGLTYPDGKQVAYTYDLDHHLAEVAAWDTQSSEYEYDALGQLISLLRPNGVTSTYAYDELGRLTGLEHASELSSLANYSYTYDEVGNIIHAEENVMGGGSFGPTIEVSITDTTGEPLVGKTVYAYNGKTYSNYSKVTDENGQVSITLPDGLYRFRVDVDGTQFWSGETDHCEIGSCGQVTMTIPEAVLVTVMDSNNNYLAEQTVYAFEGATYSSHSGKTDENGQVSLRLPEGEYRFRTDSGGTQFWSAALDGVMCPVPGCTVAEIMVTVPLVVTVRNDLGDPMANLTVYAFNNTTYANISAKTNANGQVNLTLPEGDYRFRADFNGTQFWSAPANHCAIPGCGEAAITVSLPVTVTVVDTAGNLMPNVNVYAFDGTTYKSFSKKTDANGVGVFTLPAGEYRFRADYNSTQFWSGAENTCAIPGCTTDAVTVTQPVTVTVLDSNGAPQENLNIYAFSGSTYAGYSKKTNASGEAVFTLPLADYRFRADLNGTQFWSGSGNTCSLPECGSDNVSVTIPLQVVVQDGANGIGSINVYAYNGAAYTGYSKTTGVDGVALFTLPMGEYRFRADVNPAGGAGGTQVFSNAVNHCTVPGCELVGIQIGIAPTQTPTAIPTETFTETPTPGITVTEAYTPTIPAGTNTPAGENTPLPVNTNTPEPENTATPTLETTEVGLLRSLGHILAKLRLAPLAADTGVSVTVLNTDGTPQSGLNVYAFDGTTYSGKSAVTNESGMASFTLAEGNYRFCADLNSTQFWSAAENHCTTPACTEANITVTKPITIAVQDTDGTAQSGLNVYAFNGTTYAGYSKVSNESGQAVFTLPQGDYRFRADTGGTQFWSSTENACTLPGCEAASVTVSKSLTVTVRSSDGTTQAGLNVYAFNGTTYAGYSKVTGENGQALFILPQGEYRFRADLNGTQFWSSAANDCSLPGCGSVEVSVTIPLTVSVVDSAGTPQSTIAVYAFNGTTYMNFSKTTNEVGQAVFTLPEGDYRFRADIAGTQFWSSETNDCTLPGCTAVTVSTSKPVSVTVVDSLGTPQAGLNVYAYDGTTYAGYSKISDGNGTAAFYLPAGDYRFRADVPPSTGAGGAGTQFWSAEENTCTLPGCESVIISVTQPLTVTVVDTDGTPQAGLNVYAFDGETYSNYSKVSDENGQAIFSLPQGDYRFRADLNGTQFWSADENSSPGGDTCTLPGCISDSVTVTKPLTVTVAGAAGNPYADLNVYAFDGVTYAGYSGKTDAGGKVVFTLPLGNYRFRADFDGVQFWSGNENTCSIPSCGEDSVILPGGTGEQEVSIDYTYDALNRLTSATYSNGTKFAYTYDAAGNVLTYAATHYGLTTTTTYTYDEANQLLSAVDSSTATSTGSGQAWQYTYDGNGSLLQSDPGTGAANGSTRYTYNTAGYLVKLETHNGTDWQAQSEMKYDGLGNRLEMTTYVDGTPSTTRYQLDNGQTLAAIAGETSTFTLYGRGVIGTLGESWSYILQDGAGSTRQLVDTEGAVQLSISYTPWGDTLEIYGSGMLNLGYMGGVYDAGTGLIYMGNGQYYDPSTGRFLTRGANADQSNPYTPWNSDPSGMLIAPLALLALVFGRKKNRTKLDQFVILIVIGLSIGLSVSACGVNDTPTVVINITPVPPPTSMSMPAQSGNDDGDMPDEPIWEPAEKPSIPICNGFSIEYGIEDVTLFASNGIGQFYGTKADYIGVLIATYYKELIEYYANQSQYVTPIMVAVGIAIQSNYSGNIIDKGQDFLLNYFPNLYDSSNDAFGIGGFSENQIEQLLKRNGDPRDPKVAIQAMVKRIERVLGDKKVIDNDFVCTETDKMILSFIAQQNNDYSVGDVLDQKDYTTGGNGITNINWRQYFSDLAKNDKIQLFKEHPTVTIAKFRTSSVDYNTQFMLQRAVLDLEYMKKFGWIIPTNEILEEMKSIADSKGGR